MTTMIDSFVFFALLGNIIQKIVWFGKMRGVFLVARQSTRRHCRRHPQDRLGHGISYWCSHHAPASPARRRPRKWPGALPCRNRRPPAGFVAAGNPVALGRPFRGLVFQFQIPPLDQAVGKLFFEFFLNNVLIEDKTVDTVLEIADEFPGPKALDQDDVRNGCRQSTVLSRLYRQPDIRFGCGGRKSRFDDHYLGPVDERCPSL